MHPESSTPTIGIIAADLLASLLQEWLTTAGYHVIQTHHDDLDAIPWAHVPLDLLIGELRYPIPARLRQVVDVHQRTARPVLPLLVLAAPSAITLDELPAGATWMATPVDQAWLLDCVRDLLDTARTTAAGAPPAQRSGYGSLLQ